MKKDFQFNSFQFFKLLFSLLFLFVKNFYVHTLLCLEILFEFPLIFSPFWISFMFWTKIFLSDYKYVLQDNHKNGNCVLSGVFYRIWYFFFFFAFVFLSSVNAIKSLHHLRRERRDINVSLLTRLLHFAIELAFFFLIFFSTFCVDFFLNPLYSILWMSKRNKKTQMKNRKDRNHIKYG